MLVFAQSLVALLFLIIIASWIVLPFTLNSIEKLLVEIRDILKSKN